MLGTWTVVLAILALQVGTERTAANPRLVLPGLLNIEDADSVWRLEALGVPPGAGRRHSRERLIVLSPDGHVIRTVEGGDRHVLVSSELDRLLSVPGSGVTLVHNHPEGHGLSSDDLSQLDKAGVGTVVAIGHDGSMYSASRGSRFAAHTSAGSVEDMYAIGRAEADRVLRTERDSTLRQAFAVHVHHVISTALREAGILSYRSALGSERQVSFNSSRLFLARVREAAVAAVVRPK